MTPAATPHLLQSWREDRRLSLAAVCEQTGLTAERLRRLEVGAIPATALPLGEAVALCDALGLPLEELAESIRHDTAARAGLEHHLRRAGL